MQLPTCVETKNVSYTTVLSISSIEELIQMNHQQRQQLSVQPGSAQNGPQGPASRDKTAMQQTSSAIGQGW